MFKDRNSKSSRKEIGKVQAEEKKMNRKGFKCKNWKSSTEGGKSSLYEGQVCRAELPTHIVYFSISSSVEIFQK